MQDDAELVDIGTGIDTPLYLFGGHITRGADNGAGVAGGMVAGDAKIGEIGEIVFIVEDVIWFYIAMIDFALVGFVEGGHKPVEEEAEGGGGDWVWLAKAVAQGAADEVAHDEIGATMVLANIIEGDDGIMF